VRPQLGRYAGKITAHRALRPRHHHVAAPVMIYPRRWATADAASPASLWGLLAGIRLPGTAGNLWTASPKREEDARSRIGTVPAGVVDVDPTEGWTHMRTIPRLMIGGVAATAALIAAAAPALAHECTNISKPPGAGVQVILNSSDEIIWATPGLMKRFEQGLVNPDDGTGFHGLVGFDVDGDGAADFSTYIVTPNSELPMLAQLNGAQCQGIVNIGVIFDGTCVPT
jgi:hypothetical protein